MTQKKFLAIGSTLFLVGSLFLTVALVRQRQEIRKRAATPGGAATAYLSTPATTYFASEIIPVQLKFNTAGLNISTMTFRIMYPFSGSPAELEIVDEQGNPDSTPFVLNPGFSGQWNTPVNLFYSSGSQRYFDLSAIYPVAGPGFSTTTDILLGTFYLKVNRVPAGGTFTLSFDQTESKILTKVDYHDILSSPASRSLTISSDTTPPTNPVVTDDGQYTTSTTQLHATWSASDPESGIVEYQYAIGTGTGSESERTNAVSWTTPVPVAAVQITKTGLNLTSGTTYYFSVKAKNRTGQWSNIGSSNGIKVDTSLPTAPVVTDDGETTSSTTQLHAAWTASSDLESTVAEYKYAIGTGTGSEAERINVRGWTSAGINLQVTATGLSLTVGTTYYISVKAKNGAGLENIGVSNGIRPVATTFSFKVKLQGITTSGKVKAFSVWFKKETTIFSFDVGVLTSETGGIFSNYSLPLNIQSLPSDTYNVLIKDRTVTGTNSRSNHLKKSMGSAIITGGGNTFDWSGGGTKILKSGDADDNNHITVADIVQILESYTALSVSVNDTNRTRDLNSDGYISIEDVALALSNYTALDIHGDE